MMSISIAIVDDKPINRQTVKDKLIDQIGILIVFEAKNGLDFLEKLKLASIKPDVVLMDLEMPEMNGIEAISIATAAYPSIKFIVLTVFEENDKIFEDNNVKIAVEKKSFLYLAGTILEFSGGLNGKGFVFNNPNAQRTCGCGESFSL